MEGTGYHERLRTVGGQAWASVEPVGVFRADWPPPASSRVGVHFVQVAIDDTQTMPADAGFVVDGFPEPDLILAVLPVPSEPGLAPAVGYHVGQYGAWWPTEPKLREVCRDGGFVTVKGGAQQSLVEVFKWRN